MLFTVQALQPKTTKYPSKLGFGVYIYIYSIRLQCDVVNFSMLWYSFDFFEDQPEEVERCFQPRDGFFAATLAMQIALDHPRDVHRLDLLE